MRLDQPGLPGAEIQLQGISTFVGLLLLTGSAREARVEGSGNAQIELGRFSIERARVQLTKNAGLTITVTERLDYEVSDSSELVYRGEPRIGQRSIMGTARVVRE